VSDKRAPWIKWYPADWRADPRLRMCSLAARGLWIEMLGYMHEGEPYGRFVINGRTPQPREIAALVGAPIKVVEKALEELRENGVFSVDDDGLAYSRRMVRDKARAEADRANGKGGGNPKLRARDNPDDAKGVNPPDKAQRLEARSQKPEARIEPSVLRTGAAGADQPVDDPLAIPEFLRREHPKVAAPEWDLKSQLFGSCLAWLAKRLEKPPSGLRSVIGKWIKDYGEGAVLEAFTAAQKDEAVEPVGYITKALQARANVKRGRDYTQVQRDADSDLILRTVGLGVAAAHRGAMAADPGGAGAGDPADAAALRNPLPAGSA
jgi:hypothetical protein